MLTTQQTATLKALALADPTAAAFIAQADDQALANWFNAVAVPAVKAWRVSVPREDLFDMTPIVQFSALTAGARDAWKLLLDNAPVNASRNKVRVAVTDIWAAPQATTVLTAMTEDATRAQAALGGNDATDGSVTARRRAWTEVLDAAAASQVRVA